jgi:peptidoglycan/xylan/chitin deacetylase (PgdA/CDA1 family)
MPPVRLLFYAATTGLLALTGTTLLGKPPSLGWALSALVAYVALILCSVFVLRWRVFVDAVVRLPRGTRGVALTFDDGPHPVWTPRILGVLSRYGVKATFFVIGRKAEEHPDVVRALLDAGHSVALHSYDHDRLFALRGERRVREDLERGLASLEKITGERPVLFRPPIGHTNPIISRVAEALGLIVVGWTVGARDGIASARVDDVVARVRRELRDGAIVLLHDSPERGDREPAALRALPAILDALHAERLSVVALTDSVKTP